MVALASRDLPFDDGIWCLGQSQIIIADGPGYLYRRRMFASTATSRFATAEHPPLYPALLAAMAWLGHGSVLALQMTSAVVGAAGVTVIGLLGRPRGWTTCRACCRVPVRGGAEHLAVNALLLSESILALTFGLYLLALYRLWDRPSIGAAAFAGVTLALAGYNRAELLLLGVLAIPIVLRNPRLAGARCPCRPDRGGGRRRRRGGRAWTIRNLTTFQRPVLFSDNVDSVLAGANCPQDLLRTRDRRVGFRRATRRCSGPDGTRAWPSPSARHAGTLYFRHHLDEVPLVVLARVGRDWGLLQAVRGDRERRSRRVAVDRERRRSSGCRPRSAPSARSCCAAPAG